jgi:multicomponent K+:H+ antiporter subunit A
MFAVAPPMTLAALLLLPLAAGCLLALLPERARPGKAQRDGAVAVALAATLAAVALLATLSPAVFRGEVPAIAWRWLPFPGADFGLRADGLAWAFAALVLGIGALVIVYARYYLADDDPPLRFFARVLFFMTAMLGLVLADNLLLLVVFWELTSLVSFLLIGYWSHRADARRGARLSLIVTGLGGLCLLAGVLLIGGIVGSFKLDVVLAAGAEIRGHPAYAPALLLVLLGVFTKSAQVPFHFWLPEAMAAPTPVSAYLHSATLVKAGVFLLARLHPALAGTELWFFVVGGVGLATFTAGAYIAVFQHDLKGLLAYSTISHLGLITLLFGLNEPLATVAGIFHVFNHATFKASLFMAAGIIDHETGTRDMRRINGLWRFMPLTGVLAITSSMAMAGVPLLNGFLSKEMFFAGTLSLGGGPVVQVAVPLLATIAAALSVAYSTRFVHDVFWNGEPRGLPRVPHEPPAWMLVPVGILAVLCLLVGVVPDAVIGPVLAVSARPAVGGRLPEYTLAVWHGVNLPLVMSMLALGTGVVFYAWIQRIVRLHELVHLPRGGRQVFDALLGWVTARAGWLTGRLGGGRLQYSLRWVLLTAVLACVMPVIDAVTGAGMVPAADVNVLAATLWALATLATAGILALRRQRLVALLLVGSIGLLVALAFAGLSAPDLALTQLLVEVTSTILLLLALRFLPAESPVEERTPARLLDCTLAVLCGAGVTALAWAVMTRPSGTIAGYYLENALPQAAGANVVNVIIVDFRGLDTLGEILVLVLAGLVVAGALAGWRGPAPALSREGGGSFLLERIAAAVLPLAISVAAFMFLRGHNLPGGGFIGGLVLAAGVLLLYLANGITWVEQRVPFRYESLCACGLLVAAFTGLGSLALAFPFLTSTYLAPVLPWIGKVPVATAMFFDLGVLLAVVGATLLALDALGRAGSGERSPA